MKARALLVPFSFLAIAALVGSWFAVPIRGQLTGTVSRVVGDPRTPIASLPYTITRSGSYVVTRNLIGSSGQEGITIEADDVTLDLNGFTLRGVPGSLNGIRITMGSGIRIHDGTVRGWGAAGILGPTALYVSIERCAVRSCGGDGIRPGIRATVDSALVEGNGGTGVDLGAMGAVRHARIESNGGAYEFVGAPGCTLYLTQVIGPGGALMAGDRTRIRSCSIQGASMLGSNGSFDATYALLTGSETISFQDGNAIRNSHFDWMNASGGPGITIGSNNVVEGNNILGDGTKINVYVRINGSDNQAHGNRFSIDVTYADAVLEIQGSRNVLNHNDVHAAIPMGAAAIKVASGAANTIAHNSVLGDGVAAIDGIRLQTNDNTVVSNVFGQLGGAEVDDSGSGNLVGPPVNEAGVGMATNPASQWSP